MHKRERALLRGGSFQELFSDVCETHKGSFDLQRGKQMGVSRNMPLSMKRSSSSQHFLTILVVMLGILLPSAIAQATPQPWKPHPNVACWPEFSNQTCAGDSFATRACHFRNLVFDKQPKVFVYHATAAALRELGLQPEVVHTEYLRLGLGTYSKEHAFHIKFTTRPFPSSKQTCIVKDPIYMHSPHRQGSFGHVLRDNHQNIVDNLYRLRLSATPRKLVITLPSISTSFKKYASYVAASVDTWANVVSRCSKPYIIFADIAAGNGMHRDLRAHNQPPEMCAPPYFLQQREMAYRFSQLPTEHSVDGQNVKVVLLNKQKHDKRRITNIPDLLPVLQQRFQSFRIESWTMAPLSPRTQLELLSNTTIFVAPIGSASFRLIYLPDGAHSILVGAPERRDVHPFREADACWDRLQYVTVDRYRITQPEEYIVRFKREHWITKKSMYERFMWWDSDSRLNATKLGDLIEQAFASIRGTQST